MKENELLKIIRHIALATVNEDGAPHNTPLFFAIDEEIKNLYFASKESSLHSRNFVRTGEGFAVLYDSNIFKGGIYLTLKNCRKATDKELPAALDVYTKRLVGCDNDALPPNFHEIEDGYRLYVGEIAKIEVYHAKEDANGHVKNEERREVTAEELLNE